MNEDLIKIKENEDKNTKEIIIKTAEEILKEHIEAFKELAK